MDRHGPRSRGRLRRKRRDASGRRRVSIRVGRNAWAPTATVWRVAVVAWPIGAVPVGTPFDMGGSYSARSRPLLLIARRRLEGGRNRRVYRPGSSGRHRGIGNCPSRFRGSNRILWNGACGKALDILRTHVHPSRLHRPQLRRVDVENGLTHRFRGKKGNGDGEPAGEYGERQGAAAQDSQ